MVPSEAEIEARLADLRRRREAIDREIADHLLYLELGRRLRAGAAAGDMAGGSAGGSAGGPAADRVPVPGPEAPGRAEAADAAAARDALARDAWTREAAAGPDGRAPAGSWPGSGTGGGPRFGQDPDQDPGQDPGLAGHRFAPHGRAPGTGQSGGPGGVDGDARSRAVPASRPSPRDTAAPAAPHPGSEGPPPPVPFDEDPAAARRYGRALVEAAVGVLAAAGRPMHAGEILEHLVARGFGVPGQDPVAALNTRLWKRSGPGGPLRRLGEAVYDRAGPSSP
ncbi:hypothetical protein BHAOGJBA_2757 [Methylobacterium hispanicum]|uniref:HTH HARE-type domain-containing protein n=1 Tax=Methylobacterium hispanicum TaxID=270350 RepID=A0AAV4ZN11_9HYPH|nr:MULTISPECIES: hypothetical protein [Methylobacterium]GJD89231.1 hypothetical protein BHAOGJBA_2757 [Methylobacterium hispanicum]